MRRQTCNPVITISVVRAMPAACMGCYGSPRVDGWEPAGGLGGQVGLMEWVVFEVSLRI